MDIRVLICIFLAVLSGCQTVVTNSGLENLPARPENCEIIMFGEFDSPPELGDPFGEISIGDSGFSVNCDEQAGLKKLKENACKRGASVIKITKHNAPDWVSTCHRFRANLYKHEEKTENTVLSIDLEQLKNNWGKDPNIHPIEGIWATADQRYKLAIIESRDNEQSFEALVLETTATLWSPNDVKIKFSKTAYEKILNARYYLGNKIEQTATAIISESGLLELNFSRRLEGGLDKVVLIKIFPPFKSASTELDKPVIGQGTCFAVNSEGELLTNHHVVEGATKVEVRFEDGSTFLAKVTSFSQNTDLAVLQIERKTLNFIPLSTTSKVAIGDDVFTLGYPSANLLGNEVKYTEGVISSLSGVGGDSTWMQVSVPIQPGNSGGPLVDTHGHAIGVVTATAEVKNFLLKTGSLPQNVNWVVKADYALPLVKSSAKKNTTSKKEAIGRAKKAICQVIANL